MRLSKNWLSEFVDMESGVTNRQFAEKMAMSGFCIGGVDTLSEGIENVVVGKVLETEPHPTNPKYTICKVDVGSEVLTQVTAAPNVVAGAICPVCLPGGMVKGGHSGGKRLEAAEVGGVMSSGMLCSLEELGLTVSDFPYGAEYGIFLMDEKCEIGQDIKEVLNLNDLVYDVEVTANRPDAQSVIGISREVAAAFDKPFKSHTPTVKAGGGDMHELLDVEVINTDLCPRYTARIVKNVKIGPSPRWLRERVRAGGMRPINNIVDITNYILMEYGQPMHAFDIREIAPTGAKGKIIVRTAGDDTKFTTLDKIERDIPSETLMICNDHEPIGIAGIMGGLESGIKEDTATIVFESANFHYAGLRRSGRKLGLHTDALAKYEKGIDPQMTLDAVNRACELCEMLECAEVMDGIIDIDNTGYKEHVITLEPDKINRLNGTDLSREQMVNYLTRLGFKVEGDNVHVPHHRADCTGMADLAEEVVRLYGLNNVPSVLHKGVAEGMYSPRQAFENSIVKTLLGFGFYEAVTYSFMSPKQYDRIRLSENSPLRNSLVISNPLGEDTSIMRTTTIPSMCDVIKNNYNYRNLKAKMFELAKIFIPTEDPEALPIEKVTVTIGMYGECDFYDVKGVIESLFESLRIKKATFTADRENPTFHTGRSAKILIEGKEIGQMGELHPIVQENYGIGTPSYVAVLDIEGMFESVTADPLYQPLPKYPAITRDIALVCDEHLEVAGIESIITEICGELLESLTLFDVYRGEHMEEGKKSVAYSMVFRDKNATLKDENVTKLRDKVIEVLGTKYGIVLRR